MPLRRFVLLLCCALRAQASDHLDTAAVIADPASDIGDLYAWMAPDGKRLNLVMTIVGKTFSDHVSYAFHIDSGLSRGKTTDTVTVECVFHSAWVPECALADIDRARGDAGGDGIDSEHAHFRVFAGMRDDPFYNNVRGTRAALNVAAEAMRNGVARDAGGCPHFDAATSARILDEWRHTDGRPAENFLAGWSTAALVVSVDTGVVNRGGAMLAVWATTTVRPAPPGHPPLEAGTSIDRMGRALTAQALIGTFDSREVSDARKSAYNRAPQDTWEAFAPELAATLAIYDGFDGKCGNQWLSAKQPPLSRYQPLALLLADDRLWIDSRAAKCGGFLSLERHAKSAGCGGRTPNDDAVDVFRSLLVMGRVSGVDDGVVADDRSHSASTFPFLAPP